MTKSSVSNALPLLLFSCLHFSCPAKAENIIFVNCNTTLNYSSGSVYELNLNRTLALLTANVSLSGFYITSTGEGPDMVYGLIQCRGDISKQDCQTCANIAAMNISQLCHNNMEGFIGYDYCSLRYSNSHFFSTVSNVPTFWLCNLQNATDPVLFNRQLEGLLKNLSANAAASASRFAAGNTSYTDFINIYALVQCTRDLEEANCLICLQSIISYIPNCDEKVGGQMLSKSCYIRYEVYSFYMLSSPPPSALLPNSTSPATNNSTNSDGRRSMSKTIVIVVIPVSVAFLVMLIICAGFFWRMAKKYGITVKTFQLPNGVDEGHDKGTEALVIELETLRVATRNFSDACKLGEGGFGQVYKGKLPDGQEIAVKRLSSGSGQGLEQLRTEVMVVAKLLHRNLVRLLGFCLEEKEKLLVYEYLPNGSLDKILYDRNRRSTLMWGRRYEIIVGVARGLLYLHEDSQLRIVHRDLKASNILLDQQMNPKISDFGLAKLFGGSQTQGKTKRISGTYGYMAPEYAKKGLFSNKSDVYSFGILILEIITGRKNSSFGNGMNLPSYAWQHWANRTALEILDPTIGDQCPRSEVLKCIHLGLLCIQKAAADRPTMSEIVMMLTSSTITTPLPSRPAFFISRDVSRTYVGMEDSGVSRPDRSKAESLQQSVNDVTITELCPR